MVKWSSIALAVIGCVVGAYIVATARQPAPNPPPAQSPSFNPFERGIAAEGLVEAAGREVAVAPPEPGLITAMLVDVNDSIQVGAPLFRLDGRLLEANRIEREAGRAVAAAELDRLRALPRPEDLPIREAARDRARALRDDARRELARVRQAAERSAATPNELSRANFALEAAEAQLAEAQGQLDEMRAGAWAYEIGVAEARLKQAEAELAAIQLRLDRMTVRSPIDGVVLKRHLEPGEYAAGGSSQPVFTLGDLSRLHVRAQIDEEDLPHLRPGAGGMARLRGRAGETIPLRMVRIEPLAEPKIHLTGAYTELVDTRVVEVVFEVQADPGVRIYSGQLVDVFINAAAPSE